MKYTLSEKEYQRAQQLMPGGVNSPVRAFRNVNRHPVFIERAKDAYIKDIDGNSYIDYVGSWGPMLLGHSHPQITETIKTALLNGTSFGAATKKESELAELIQDLVPSMQMLRFVNSGTEATMSALRLARGYTGREKFIKFNGCYHGHGDSFLVKAGSGALTFGEPDSAGITKGTAIDTLTAQYNNLLETEELFDGNPGQIAAVIVEPVAGNMGTILPQKGFLEGLRKLCDKNGALLIFDEVMTGFRVARGGAQELFGVLPDITTLGKIIGGGLPVGAYGGRKEIMQKLSPLGDVYQAGTLSGNPLAMAAGLAMISLIKEEKGLYESLERKGKTLEQGLRQGLQKYSIPAVINRCGSMFSLFFTQQPHVNHLDHVLKSNKNRFIEYFQGMLERGIYLAPSAFEAGFISQAHTDAEIQKTLNAANDVLESLSKKEK